jgi:hypothetical protein
VFSEFCSILGNMRWLRNRVWGASKVGVGGAFITRNAVREGRRIRDIAGLQLATLNYACKHKEKSD